ncbi:MAG: hypothetical protein AB7O97_05485 [Planctomycetota bacterium]
MAAHTHERRKKLIVNRPLQSRLMLNMALLPGIALAGIAVFTGVYCARLMDEAMATDTELPGLMPLFYLVIAFELLAAVFLMVNSLKISHKVAGPAYRLTKCIERIRSGDLAFTVQFRRGDHLQELKDEFNKLLDWLNDNPPAGCVTRAEAARRQLAEQAAAATTDAPTGEPTPEPVATATPAAATPEGADRDPQRS